MNRLYTTGFLYVIVRDIGKPKDRIISTGFMRQTGTPWKTGKGIQLRIGKYVTQIGVCKADKERAHLHEQDGLLYAMQGRLMEEPPSKIGNW
jgi:hypothetical protein